MSSFRVKISIHFFYKKARKEKTNVLGKMPTNVFTGFALIANTHQDEKTKQHYVKTTINKTLHKDDEIT
jgi:hypothetical protein